MRFDGKVLLVTGGASGLGAAVGHRFTAEGGQVAVVDLDDEKAEAVAGKLDGAIAMGVDVAAEEAVGRCVDQAAQHFGSIDCLFNAAGHAEFGPIEEWSLERWQRMMTVHAGGTFLFCRQVLPVMRERAAGAIVNVASVAALAAQAGNAPYGAAKGAILAFSRQLARDVAPEIRVNTVAPGRIAHRHDRAADDQAGRKRRARIGHVRPGQPAEAGGRARGDRRTGLLPAL